MCAKAKKSYTSLFAFLEEIVIAVIEQQVIFRSYFLANVHGYILFSKTIFFFLKKIYRIKCLIVKHHVCITGALNLE